jgi:arylsulfatase A-like enzyme
MARFVGNFVASAKLFDLCCTMKHWWLSGIIVAIVGLCHAVPSPNLIFILADDLGYGELGCYGQKIIRTPEIDRMAQEGLRFSHYYAGATVCAPSRSVLLTGQHQGRTRVRGNREGAGLTANDVSVARILRDAGYRTAIIGKWGLGEFDGSEEGLPWRQGFDEFYGYLNHQHAHNHFPAFLWRNDRRETLRNVVTAVGNRGAGYATVKQQYADDLFAEEALRFVDAHRDRPFFLFWSMVVPHANNERHRKIGNGAEAPDLGSYAKEPWSENDRAHAAMIERMDGYVGRLLAHLKKIGIAEKTLVIFTSDNGPHRESGHQLTRFQPAGPFSGIKRSLTDGGIRVPFIAWWPKTIAPGRTSDYVGSFADWWATAADLVKAPVPKTIDGVSIVPTLRGEAQKPQKFLYWEFHENGFQQAVLYQGRWKALKRGGADRPLLLFDTRHDVEEKRDVASSHPDLVKIIESYLLQARKDDPAWEPQW